MKEVNTSMNLSSWKSDICWMRKDIPLNLLNSDGLLLYAEYLTLNHIHSDLSLMYTLLL
jgi:hypothetical protein